MEIRDGLQPKPHGAVSTGFQNFVDMNRHENLGNVFAFHQVSKQQMGTFLRQDERKPIAARGRVT